MQFDNYIVRQPKLTDLENYFQMIERNRPRLEDFFAGTVSKTKTYGDTEVFLADMMRRIKAKTYLPFIIIDSISQTIIGYVDVKNIDWNLPKAELGCYIDESCAGKGISKKALLLVIRHLFDDHGFNKLFLRTHQENQAARALAEACGFEREGLLRRDYKTTKGEIVDLIYYGLLKPGT